MPIRTGLPIEVVDIVIASIIFFVGANYIIRFFIDRKKPEKKETKKVLDASTTSGVTRSVPEDTPKVTDREGGEHT